MACLNATLRGEQAAFEFALESENETKRHFECRYAPNAGGQVLAIIRDITARKRTEAHIHRLAYFDVLTGLPNREWLGDYLSQSLVEARRENCSVAVLYIDLDQFKRINDTLGHQTGDALLRMVSDRLNTLAGTHQEDEVHGQFARVGGDEFILVLTGNPNVQSAQRTAGRIQAALVAPFLHGGYEFVVTPSIGIALFPEHGNDGQSLLKNADGAMYEAKACGRNQYRVYTSAVHARALKRLSLEMELRQAFENSQLQVYYQPKYEPETDRRGGTAALVPFGARADSDDRLRGRGGGNRTDRRHRTLGHAASVLGPVRVARSGAAIATGGSEHLRSRFHAARGVAAHERHGWPGAPVAVAVRAGADRGDLDAGC
jgi:diguanylate cyclase (GGDEF)-like protein